MPKQQRSREKYERIMEAAETLVSREGFDSFTIVGVAQVAGLPASAFYRFFADKDDLARALLARHLMKLDEVISSTVATLDARYVAQIARAMLLAVVDYYLRNPSHRALWHEARIGAAARREVQAHTSRLVQAVLEQARASGVVAPDSTFEDLEPVIYIADRVIEVAFREDKNGDPDLLERGLAMVLAVVASLERDAAAPGSAGGRGGALAT